MRSGDTHTSKRWLCEVLVHTTAIIKETLRTDVEMKCLIDQHGMWQMIGVHGFGGKLLKAIEFQWRDEYE